MRGLVVYSAEERDWMLRFRVAISLLRTPFDVWFDCANRQVHIRKVGGKIEPKPLPADAVLVGRYQRPFTAASFIDDLRLVLAELKA